MSSVLDSCSVCDGRIDPHGRDGTRCARCKEPCSTCGGDVTFCLHSLSPRPSGLPVGVKPIPLGHLYHLLEGAAL